MTSPPDPRLAYVQPVMPRTPVHPIVQSFEPGESWRHVDEAFA